MDNAVVSEAGVQGVPNLGSDEPRNGEAVEKEQVSVSRFRYEGLIIALVAFILYFATSSPYIGFGDTAILVDAIERGHAVSHVNNHPLTVLLGWIFTTIHSGEPAASANFLSVCAGAVTVWGWFVCVRIAGVTRVIATLAAFSTMVMHSLWWHSTIIENYAVTSALVMAVYGFLLHFDRTKDERGLLIACALAGLSISNHVQNSFLCVGVGVSGVYFAIKSGKGLRIIFPCLAAALVGLLPWCLLVIRDAMRGPGFSVIVKDAFVGKFESTFFGASWASIVWDTLFIVWNQSPLLLLPVAGAVGAVSYLRRSGVSAAFVGIATHIALTVSVFSGYPTWDRFAFLLPALMGMAVFAGIGLQAIADWLGQGRGGRMVGVWSLLTALVCPMLYSSVVVLARDPSSIWSGRFANTHSANLYDQARFIADPIRTGYDELEVFAQMLKEKLPHGAVFLDDDSRTFYTLAEYFQKHRGMRPDVRFLLVNSWGFSDWGIGASQLASIMEDAYRTGKPFFFASIGYPYQTFMSAAKKKFPVSVTPFSLGAGKWVYKLDSLPEGTARSLADAQIAMREGKLKAVFLSGASGETDLTMEHVKFSSADSVMLQDMSPFGPLWRNGNQLFVNTSSTGGEVELFILNQDSARANSPRSLKVFLTKAFDFGQVEILINQKVVGKADLFSSVVGRTEVVLPEVTLPPDGIVLTFKVVGKHPSSHGFKFGIDLVGFK